METQEVTTVVETPAEPSLMEHAEAFTKPPAGAKPFEAPKNLTSEALEKAQTETADAKTERDEKGQFVPKPPKHRAEKDKARAEDVPRILELNRKLGETERTYQARIAELERERDEWKGKASTPRTEVVSGFTEPKPTLDDMIKKGVDDPYLELTEALIDWKERKKSFESQQQTAKETTSQQEQARNIAFGERLTKFRERHADYMDVIHAGPTEKMTPVMWEVCTTDDNGPEMMYNLAQQPKAYRELLALTKSLDPTVGEDVALATQLMKDRALTATTASVAPTRTTPLAPTPPNAVRTGPMKTGDELPGDDATLMAHAKAFTPKGRFGR